MAILGDYRAACKALYDLGLIERRKMDRQFVYRWKGREKGTSMDRNMEAALHVLRASSLQGLAGEALRTSKKGDVDWGAIWERYDLYSRGERLLIRVAAQFVGQTDMPLDIPLDVKLGELLRNLDREHVQLVAEAVCIWCGVRAPAEPGTVAR